MEAKKKCWGWNRAVCGELGKSGAAQWLCRRFAQRRVAAAVTAATISPRCFFVCRPTFCK